MLTLGLDLGTQSLKGVVLDHANARVAWSSSVRYDVDLSAFHSQGGLLPNDDPRVRHADPVMWAAAVELLFGQLAESPVDSAQICAISGAAQQRGTVYLRGPWQGGSASQPLTAQVARQLARPSSPTWMDCSTSTQCQEISSLAGGVTRIRALTGSTPLERFAGPQVRKYWYEEPGGYAATGRIHLVSSFLGCCLAGVDVPIDPCDAAGMNLLDIHRLEWDEGLCAVTAPGLRSRLPVIGSAHDVIGEISPRLAAISGLRPGTPVTMCTGDNPASLVALGGGIGAPPVVSLGTSHTVAVSLERIVPDPSGCGSVAPGPLGGYMHLTVLRNGALTTQIVLDLLGFGRSDLDQVTQLTDPGNRGDLMLPYALPETTPLVLEPGIRLSGSRSFVAGAQPQALVRALIESQAMRLHLHSQWQAPTYHQISVTGGGWVGPCRRIQS